MPSIEAYTLTEDVFQMAARLGGTDRGPLPPFPSLTIAVPALVR